MPSIKQTPPSLPQLLIELELAEEELKASNQHERAMAKKWIASIKRIKDFVMKGIEDELPRYTTNQP